MWQEEEVDTGGLRRHRQDWPLFKVGVLSRSVGVRVGSAQASNGDRKSALNVLLMDLCLQGTL